MPTILPLLFLISYPSPFHSIEPKTTPMPSPDPLTETLTGILTKQQTAWNSGDIAGFMDAYWKDEGLTFSSGGKVARGWTATFERYKKRYPDQETMGQLTFSDLEATALGQEAAVMLGRWKLQRKSPVSGSFTLVFRKVDDQWVIIHDHTSADAD